MTITSTIRAWLGLDTLPSVEMYKAMEKKQKERHDELLTRLNAIEKRFDNSRPPQQSIHGVPLVDWEQVQSMALQQLEQENANDRTKEN